jgi:REP element-mobilizing transposase RayT
LGEYNYAQAGAYFVTICTHNRACLFGEIANGAVVMNDFGRIAEEEWLKTPGIRPQIELDEYVIMPNHIHGILVITTDKGVLQYAPTHTLRSPSQTIGSVIRGWKSAVTTKIKKFTGNRNMRVWQRNYYEHVIRNEQDLSDTRQYILTNPARWAMDRENPMRCEG